MLDKDIIMPRDIIINTPKEHEINNLFNSVNVDNLK